MTPPILMPTCPRCGQPPMVMRFLGVPVLPWFCENDDCDVFSWNPHVGPEQFEANHQVIDGEQW